MVFSGWLKLEQLNAWNDLVGGLPQGSMAAIVGQAEAGKTILGLQFGYEVTKQLGGSALIVDTEGSMHTYADWHKTFNKRYGERELVFLTAGKDAKTGESTLVSPVKHDSKKPYIYVVDVRSIQQILSLHGVPVKLATSDSGKMSVRPQPGWVDNVMESQIGQFMSSRDITYCAYDSITNPLGIFGTEQLNFPTRAAATNYWMLQNQLLAQELGLVQVGIFHETINPQDFDRPDVAGGISVKYNVKVAVYISRDKTKNTPVVQESKDRGRDRTSRDMWILRHPSRKPFLMHRQLDLGSRGFADIEQQQFQVPGMEAKK